MEPMTQSNVLMICAEPSLLKLVGEAASSIEALTLAHLPTLNAAYSYESWDSVSLRLDPPEVSSPKVGSRPVAEDDQGLAKGPWPPS